MSLFWNLRKCTVRKTLRVVYGYCWESGTQTWQKEHHPYVEELPIELGMFHCQVLPPEPRPTMRVETGVTKKVLNKITKKNSIQQLGRNVCFFMFDGNINP